MPDILVVGSLHYDIVVTASHLPARDETVMGDTVQFVCGGKGGNQAVSASRHGAKVSFMGAVGTDFFAEALLSNLSEAGIDVSDIARHSATASGMSVAIIDKDGEYGAVVASGANQSIDETALLMSRDTQLLILQNEIPEAVNISAARQAREIGAQVFLNAAPMRQISDELLNLVDVLIVNRVEAEMLFGAPISSQQDALAVLKTSELGSVTVITLGSEGLVFSVPGSDPQHLPTTAVDTISSHGAGDAFVGALGAKLSLGHELTDALTYASAAAALLVSTPVEKRDQIDGDAVERFLSQ